MTTWIDVGCTGGSCPKQEHCRRFHRRDEASVNYSTPPFNRYEGGEVHCNYYEHQKKEEDNT